MNHVQRARLHQVLTYLVDIFRDSEDGERGLTRWEVVEGSAADSEHIDGLLAVLVESGLVVYEDVTETRRFYRLAIRLPAQGNGDGPESDYIEVRLASGMEKRFAREDRALADKWIDESIRDEQERMTAAAGPATGDDIHEWINRTYPNIRHATVGSLFSKMDIVIMLRNAAGDEPLQKLELSLSQTWGTRPASDPE